MIVYLQKVEKSGKDSEVLPEMVTRTAERKY